METKFNFKSQMCTTVAQSECLLALGLKKDTADMGSVRDLVQITSNGKREVIFTFTPDNWEANPDSIPRWSLHRLIEMMPTHIHRGEETFIREIRPISISYVPTTYEHHFFLFKEINNTYYDGIIATIEWLIKEGYFNKEYLV